MGLWGYTQDGLIGAGVGQVPECAVAFGSGGLDIKKFEGKTKQLYLSVFTSCRWVDIFCCSHYYRPWLTWNLDSSAFHRSHQLGDRGHRKSYRPSLEPRHCSVWKTDIKHTLQTSGFKLKPGKHLQFWKLLHHNFLILIIIWIYMTTGSFFLRVHLPPPFTPHSVSYSSSRQRTVGEYLLNKKHLIFMQMIRIMFLKSSVRLVLCKWLSIIYFIV